MLHEVISAGDVRLRAAEMMYLVMRCNVLGNSW